MRTWDQVHHDLDGVRVGVRRLGDVHSTEGSFWNPTVPAGFKTSENSTWMPSVSSWNRRLVIRAPSSDCGAMFIDMPWFVPVTDLIWNCVVNFWFPPSVSVAGAVRCGENSQSPNEPLIVPFEMRTDWPVIPTVVRDTNVVVRDRRSTSSLQHRAAESGA